MICRHHRVARGSGARDKPNCGRPGHIAPDGASYRGGWDALDKTALSQLLRPSRLLFRRVRFGAH